MVNNLAFIKEDRNLYDTSTILIINFEAQFNNYLR
jgi:hypothetical protein